MSSLKLQHHLYCLSLSLSISLALLFANSSNSQTTLYFPSCLLTICYVNHHTNVSSFSLTFFLPQPFHLPTLRCVHYPQKHKIYHTLQNYKSFLQSRLHYLVLLQALLTWLLKIAHLFFNLILHKPTQSRLHTNTMTSLCTFFLLISSSYLDTSSMGVLS